MTDEQTPFPEADLPLERAIRGEAVDEVEMYVRPPGSARGVRVSTTGRPLRDESGRIVGGLIVCRDITDRRHAEETLRRSVQVIEDLYNRAPCGYHSLDPEGRYTHVNDTELSWLGYARHEVMGRKFTDFITEASLETFHAEFPKFQERGWARDIEFEMIRKDGGRITIMLSATAVKDASGQFVMSRSTLFDVTERKEAERERQRVSKALEDSEAIYHSLVECLPQNIFRKDRDGRITFGNHRYCETMKRSFQALVGKTDFDLFPKAVASKYVLDDQEVLRTGKPFEDVEEHYLPDGMKIYVQVVKTPIFDAQGAITGTQGIFWDVTEKKHAEQAVHESERRYRQLAEATQDGIILVEQDGAIALFNPAAERIFGYSASEVVGKSVKCLMPGEFHELHERGFNRYLQTRQPRVIGRIVELQGRRKDGTDFPLELSLSVLNLGGAADAEGRPPVQFLGAIRDITERNRIRAVLLHKEKLISIGQMSAGMAHEINNPLAFIGNNLAVLERDNKGLLALVDTLFGSLDRLAETDPDTAARARLLAEEIDLPYLRENLPRLLVRTREGVERVTRLVHSLRSLARTDAPKKQEANVQDLIENNLEIIRGQLKRTGIESRRQLEALPQLYCVPSQINQVLLNMLVNAVQAIEATRRKDGLISIRGAVVGDEMRLQIEDNGCGIPPKNMTSIFNPFFTTKDVGEGTGLGLSISHEIIAAHGGRIEVDSRVGEGTCFSIYLPLESRETP